ncbi:hypothetical protein [Luteimonas fraxinea]|uniref:hypothetical protein n=1 Tax=Luteimonas fraxinea TaxID=2901869 RepID=UPI001E4A0347|nr:hypothetical protein [Luteimonas fraxinea]MCD9126693.1 hypothetical protein [Luteimonas fraxinea]
MKKPFITATLALMACFTAGAAIATEVFEVYGLGVTEQQARNDARSQGRALCISAGYARASIEEVQTYSSGGGFITYAIAQCF